MTLQLLRTVHRVLGLLLLLPLGVQGITGAILTLEPPLQSSLAAVTATGDPASVNAIVAATRKLVPADMRATRYLPPPAPARAAEVWFAPRGAPPTRGALAVRIDPVTLTALGPPEAVTGALEWVRRLHTAFLIPDLGGRTIVGWIGIGLCFLSLIGLILWWPARGAWRRAFTISQRPRGVGLPRQLHGVAGALALAMFLLTGVTGATLGFPRTVRTALGLSPAGGPRPARVDPSMTPATPDLDAALALARKAAPGTETRAMVLPAGATDPIRIFLAPPGREGAAPTITVTVDATGSHVIGVLDPKTAALAEQALRWAHDLHQGQGFGLLWRGITAATGLVLSVMAATGVTMWWLRRRDRRRSNNARGAVPLAGQ